MIEGITLVGVIRATLVLAVIGVALVGMIVLQRCLLLHGVVEGCLLIDEKPPPNKEC